MTVTGADIATAEEITTAWETAGTGYGDLDDRIAAALAEVRAAERAAADQLRADVLALAEEHRRWAVINRDLADRQESPDSDFHIGMAQAQESTVRHLHGLLGGSR